jgi:hypothetical protein
VNRPGPLIPSNWIMENLELDRIVFLLTDDNFKLELKTFRRSNQRLKIRLRNNRLNGELKQVKTLISRLEAEFPVALFEHYRTKKPSNRLLKVLRIRLCQFIRRIDAIVTKATLVYGASQPHFRVGHLVQHYLVIRASLARLIFCFKALLVYAVDLYLSLHKSCPTIEIDESKTASKHILTPEEAKNILTNHNCKPKPESEPENESPEIIEESHSKKIKLNESIGVIVDRNTMRPVRACRKK